MITFIEYLLSPGHHAKFITYHILFNEFIPLLFLKKNIMSEIIKLVNDGMNL